MASQLIGTTETGWFNPGVNPPPFDMKLLLMVAGSRSEDCGRTFEPYTVVMTAYVQQQGPGDEYDDETAFDEYMSGDQTDFLDFQFDLKDEDGEVLDWYSDSIVAWAYYPLGIAQTAVNVERERQAALSALPDPEMLTAGKIDDPLGSDAWYTARTVVKLLQKERQRLARLLEAKAESTTVHDNDAQVWLDAARVVREA